MGYKATGTVHLHFHHRNGGIALVQWVIYPAEGEAKEPSNLRSPGFHALAVLLMATAHGRALVEQGPSLERRYLTCASPDGSGSLAAALYRSATHNTRRIGEAIPVGFLHATRDNDTPAVSLRQSPEVKIFLDGGLVCERLGPDDSLERGQQMARALRVLIERFMETWLQAPTKKQRYRSYFNPPLSEEAEREGPPIDYQGRLVARPVLYREMKATLTECGPGSIVRLMSFQPDHPLEENEPDINEWHDVLLKFARSDQNTGAKIHRLLSLESPAKWPWLEKVAHDFAGAAVPLTVQLFPNIADEHGRTAPLPIQLHVIGPRVFRGGARQGPGLQGRDTLGTIEEGPEVVQYYEGWYDKLWNTAEQSANGKLINAGVVQEDAVALAKARVCLNWLRRRAQGLASASEFEQLMAQVRSWDKEITSWWRRLLDDVPTPDGVPYTRSVLGAGPRTELMLARWAHGSNLSCWPHDHGGASGVVRVLQGNAIVDLYDFDDERGLLVRRRPGQLELKTGDDHIVDAKLVHAMRSTGSERLVTFHAYHSVEGLAPSFLLFDLNHGRVGIKAGGGAYESSPDDAITWRAFRTQW